MNVERRLAALRREIEYRSNEIHRIAELRAAGDAAVVKFPERVEAHLAELRHRIAKRQAEVHRLEAYRCR